MPCARRACENIGRRAATGEVQDHLARDLARKGRNALVCQAVISGENGQLTAFHAGGQAVLQCGDLRGEAFDPAKRAEGLGLGVDLSLQRGGESV